MNRHRHKWLRESHGAATAEGYSVVERIVCECGQTRRKCAQCGAMEKATEAGHYWRTGAWSCDLCYWADFR